MLSAIKGKQSAPREHVLWGFPEKMTFWGVGEGGRDAPPRERKILERPWGEKEQGSGSGVQEQGAE